MRGVSCRRFLGGVGFGLFIGLFGEAFITNRDFMPVRREAEHFVAGPVGKPLEREGDVVVNPFELVAGSPGSVVHFLPDVSEHFRQAGKHFDIVEDFGPADRKPFLVCGHFLPFCLGEGCRSGAFGGLAPERRTGRLATVRAVPKISRSVMV